MKRELLSVLVDPDGGAPLRVESDAEADGEVISGRLVGPHRSYPIVRGIPRFAGDAAGQEQTAGSFGFKWQQQPAYEDNRVRRLYEQDEPPRYGVQTYEEFRALFRGRERVLDAGCGSGHYASLYMDDGFPGEWVGFDLSSGIDIARERLGRAPRSHFVQGDIFATPFAPESFDLIISRGVMHHTPDTQRAFASLTRLLRHGGEFMFLIYRRNNPIREFTDDYVRGVVSAMPPAEAWEAIGTLTEFGRALSEARAVVTLREPVPMFGIPAGTYDVQRLVYDYFLKAFWKPEWTFDESNLISFDWWHPKYAYRHTEAEIRQWCAAAGLAVSHIDDRGTGYTVRAVKQ